MSAVSGPHRRRYSWILRQWQGLWDDRGVIDGRPTGVIRLSFGLYSTMSDVDRWIDLLLYFVDRHPEEITERKSLVKIGAEIYANAR